MEEMGPVQINAFQIIAMSSSLDLSNLFKKEVWSFMLCKIGNII